jgi:heptosyltransferase-2
LKQFLIIQTAFLGDAVLATALLEKLHTWYPDAAIDLVVRKGNDGLFTGHPFLRKLFVWDKRTNKNANLLKLIGGLRKTRYDHIINAQRFFSTGLMTVLAKGNEKIGFDKNPLSSFFDRRVQHEIPDPAKLRPYDPVITATPIVHEVDRLNALIAHLTDRSRPFPRLYPSQSDREVVDHLIISHPERSRTADRLICIAPASVWHTKQWPEEKWIELIKALPADRRILLIGSPGDMPLCDRIAKVAKRGEVLAGKLSLLATAELMKRAKMNYVNDSAPLHIASAMEAPVTAIFCSTVPAFGFGPLHSNGKIVERLEPLYCRPCGLHGYRACPEGHFKCAREIGVEQASTGSH